MCNRAVVDRRIKYCYRQIVCKSGDPTCIHFNVNAPRTSTVQFISPPGNLNI